jgi:hypothetical protein
MFARSTSSIPQKSYFVELEKVRLTPGITRRVFDAIMAKSSMTFSLIRGRVHAVVMLSPP